LEDFDIHEFMSLTLISSIYPLDETLLEAPHVVKINSHTVIMDTSQEVRLYIGETSLIEVNIDQDSRLPSEVRRKIWHMLNRDD
jgi:hypothetical protein